MIIEPRMLGLPVRPMRRSHAALLYFFAAVATFGTLYLACRVASWLEDQTVQAELRGATNPN